MHRFILVFVILFFGVTGLAFAKSKTAPEVPITQIEFVGGKLVQENWAQGLWVEYDFRGTRRYEFKKISFTPDRLSLKGLKGDVTLVVDIPGKTISGAWPGHPMAKLYEVTKISYLESTQTPKEEPFIPNYVPPGKKRPVETPKKETSDKNNSQPSKPITANNLTVASYEGGSFYYVEDDEWREESREGSIFRFSKIGTDARSVFLYDAGRKILIELDMTDKISRISHSGEALKDLYPLTDLRSESLSLSLPPIPKPPLTPAALSDGKLTVKDRASCLTKGGFIERAGILGFERCTLRYTDGGNICIDSSNCEGKCLAAVEDAQSKAVSGQCQATDNPFGCYAEVVAGTTGPTLCVD